MFGLFKTRDPHRQAATKLYGSVVAQARRPQFYTAGGVPDTMEGRFELLVLHLALLIDRLRDLDGSQDDLAQALTSRFVSDIDDNYREIGIGDTAVPRKVKKAAGVLYDRTLQYRALSEAGDRPALAAGFGEHVLRGAPASGADYLVRYHDAARRALQGQTRDALRAGEVVYPEPPAQ